MATKPLLAPAMVRNLIDYHPNTGRMFWKERPREMFPTDRAWRWWNNRYAGTEAATAETPDGYRQVKIFNKSYCAHRVAWAAFYGAWPVIIDHKNGNPSDNRIKNLRSCSRAVNQLNQKLHKTNVSGHAGVYWLKTQQKWLASIRYNNKQIHIGYYEKFEEACEARKEAEKRYGFYKRHGKSKF